MYKKIDLYLFNKARGTWSYECSTNGARSCREAKEHFCARHSLSPEQVKASYSNR